MLVRRNLKEFNDFIYLGANRVRKLMVILSNSIYIKDSLYRQYYKSIVMFLTVNVFADREYNK